MAHGIARAAGINSLGNVASRVFGLLREAVIAGTFGASGSTSAFDAVSGVPKMVYELLVGGMLSAALIPVLSEYTGKEREEELQRILSILLSLGFVALFFIGEAPIAVGHDMIGVKLDGLSVINDGLVKFCYIMIDKAPCLVSLGIIGV